MRRLYVLIILIAIAVGTCALIVCTESPVEPKKTPEPDGTTVYLYRFLSWDDDPLMYSYNIENGVVDSFVQAVSIGTANPPIITSDGQTMFGSKSDFFGGCTSAALDLETDEHLYDVPVGCISPGYLTPDDAYLTTGSLKIWRVSDWFLVYDNAIKVNGLTVSWDGVNYFGRRQAGDQAPFEAFHVTLSDPPQFKSIPIRYGGQNLFLLPYRTLPAMDNQSIYCWGLEGNLLEYDLALDTTVLVDSTGMKGGQVVLTSDGKYLLCFFSGPWAAAAGDWTSGVNLYDTESNALVTTIETQVLFYDTNRAYTYPMDFLYITPDDKWLLVMIGLNSRIMKYNLQTMAIDTVIEFEGSPSFHWLAGPGSFRTF